MGSGADARNLAKLGGNPGGPAKANDYQVGGNHYQSDKCKYQHWDIVIDHNLNYFEAQILRYTMRCRKKKNMLEDLRKAQQFIQKYIESVEEGRIVDPTRPATNECYPDTEAPAFLASTI